MIKHWYKSLFVFLFLLFPVVSTAQRPVACSQMETSHRQAVINLAYLASACEAALYAGDFAGADLIEAEMQSEVTFIHNLTHAYSDYGC